MDYGIGFNGRMVMWASIPAHGSDPVGLYNSGLARSSEVDGCRDLMHCMFFFAREELGCVQADLSRLQERREGRRV